MRKTLTITRHEFRQTLKRKSFIILTLALPLLLLLGYLIYQGVQQWYQPGEPEALNIGYVDEAGGFDSYTSEDDVTFVPYPTAEEATDALLAAEVSEYFVIPADYLSSGLIVRYTTRSELEVPGKSYNGIRSFLLSNLLAEDVSPEILERAKTPLQMASIQLDETGQVTEGQDELTKFLLPVVFGLLFVFAIFFSSGFLLQSVSEEKENRVMEIILSSVSSRQLLAGKVVGLGAAGLLQIAVWLVAIRVFAEVASVNIPALSQLSVPTNLLLLGLVYFVLGYLLFAALYAGIGSIMPTAREGQSWSGIIAVPALVPVWFNFFLTSAPEGPVARALTFIPITCPVTAMMRLSTESMAPWEIVLSLAILAGSAVLTMLVAAKAFRVFLLMYGKRPALREILRYIREA